MWVLFCLLLGNILVCQGQTAMVCPGRCAEGGSILDLCKTTAPNGAQPLIVQKSYSVPNSDGVTQTFHIQLWPKSTQQQTDLTSDDLSSILQSAKISDFLSQSNFSMDGYMQAGDGGDYQSIVMRLSTPSRKRQIGSPCLAVPSDNELENITSLLREEMVAIILQNQADFNPDRVTAVPIPGRTCEILISIEQEPGFPWYAVVFPVLAFFLLLLLLAAALWYFHDPHGKRLLSALPSAVRRQYKDFYDNPKEWKKYGSPTNFCYYKHLAPNSSEYQRAHDIFNTDCGGKNIPLDRIVAVYNPKLVSNFVSGLQILDRRFAVDPSLFTKQEWKPHLPKEAVFHHYQNYQSRFDWNAGRSIPIVPALHGTSRAAAEKICETGFVALSLIDLGFYGKGIYFTSSAEYTLTYAITQHPAIVFSWVIPGNVFPVTESVTDPDSPKGLPLKPGYNSHFVVTDCTGEVASGSDDVYTEFVFEQEYQISPAFIFHLGNDLQAIRRAWNTKCQKRRSLRPPDARTKRRDD